MRSIRSKNIRILSIMDKPEPEPQTQPQQPPLTQAQKTKKKVRMPVKDKVPTFRIERGHFVVSFK